MQDWKLLYCTKNLTEANIIKGMLEENNIPAQLLNKQDSSYLVFGEIEIYVPIHLKSIAEGLVHRALFN
ncbi:MAG: DUF2007 domain-containing protein [Sphingobacteriia bacterium]|nr:DUF2007 domain-containing protein [Sphingobacteriia bacterium]